VLDTSEPLTQKLHEYNTKARFEDQTRHVKEVIIPSIEFNISEEESNKEIFVIQPSSEAKSYTFDRSKLEQIQEVQYSLTVSERMNQKSFSGLAWLAKFLPNVKSIKFKFTASYIQRNVPENIICSILEAALSQPENIEKIDLDLSNLSLSDPVILFLVQKVLPQIKNLKSFVCDLNKTKITGQVLQAFAQTNFAAKPDLETFRLNVSDTALKEEDIVQFLNTVPNAQDLFLGFGHIELTDHTFEAFTADILPSLDKVERFELVLESTKLTDTGVQKILMNVPSTVQKLFVDMQSLEITDEALHSFLNEKLPLLVKLEELELDLFFTGVSERWKRWISTWHKGKDLEEAKDIDENWFDKYAPTRIIKVQKPKEPEEV